MKIFYLHGFQSSSNAIKAQILKKELAPFDFVTYKALDFPDDLSKSFEYLKEFIKKEQQDDEVCLIGSSLGGFLSLLLSIELKLKVALINPCLYPSEWVKKANVVGKELENFDTHEKFVIDTRAITYLQEKEKQLVQYDSSLVSVYLQTGDEVLDYKYALNFFDKIKVDVEQGGSHRYDNFESKIPKIISFFKKSL